MVLDDSQISLLDTEVPPADKYQADLVLVFPRQKHDEDGTEPQKFTSAEIDDIFDEVLTAREANPDNDDRADASDSYPKCTALEVKLRQEEGATVTLKELQDALIEDMINFLSEQGCSTDAFMSCDQDQLFMLISLGDPTKTAQEDGTALPTAEDVGLRLQTTFNTDSVPRLGIKQSILPCAEAYMPYSRAIIETSAKFFKFDRLTGAGQLLFKRYNAGVGGTQGTILRTIDRVRVLKTILVNFIDFEDLKGTPILDDFYVPHNMQKLHGFRSGYEANPKDAWDKPHCPWANFRFGTIFKGLPLSTMLSGDLRESMWKSQPIQEIRDYFGEQIAFYFLWLAYTAQAAFCAVIPAVTLSVCFFLFQPIVERDENTAFEDLATDTQKEDAGWMAIFSLCAATMYCIGGMLYLKGWIRLQNYYRRLWDPAENGAVLGHRPNYWGKMVPNPINEKKRTKVDPPCRAKCRRIMTTSVLCIFIAATVVAVLAVYRCEKVLVDDYEISPKIAKSITSMLFTCQITVFQLIWSNVSRWLVEKTNPRTDREAKDLSTRFLFPFSFVSTYANIFFHAFFKSWGESCTNENCMITMRPAMIAVVAPALALQVVSMFIPFVKYRYSLYSEMQAVEKQGKTVKRAFIESQAKRPSFEAQELNQEMNIMMILMGYVLLFGFAAPIVTFFIFVVFLVKIRVDAFKLCSVYQRVTPQMQFTGGGIGEWNEVLKGLVKIAQWTCIAVPMFNLDYFTMDAKNNCVVALLLPGDPEAKLEVYHKVMLVMVFREIVERICSFIDLTINENSSVEVMMNAKRAKVSAAFTAKMSQMHHQEMTATATVAMQEVVKHGASLAKEVAANTVPRLFDKKDAMEKFNWKDFAIATDAETYFGKAAGA